MQAIDINAIRIRRDQIDAEIAKFREMITALEAKREELDIAARVIAEIYGEHVPPARERWVDIPNIQPARPKVSRPQKPAGLPTMPEMIVEVLREAQKIGLHGLLPAMITKRIREKYWPDAPGEAVTPIVWRLWSRDHKLEKDERSGFYRVPNDQILDPKPTVTIGDQLGEHGIIPSHSEVVDVP